MRRFTHLLALIAILGLFVSSAFAAGIPQMINYEGTLSDTSGAPVADGAYSLELTCKVNLVE
jgi:hypothetical protein